MNENSNEKKLVSTKASEEVAKEINEKTFQQKKKHY